MLHDITCTASIGSTPQTVGCRWYDSRKEGSPESSACYRLTANILFLILSCLSPFPRAFSGYVAQLASDYAPAVLSIEIYLAFGPISLGNSLLSR